MFVSLKEFIAVKQANSLDQFLKYKNISLRIDHEKEDFFDFCQEFYKKNPDSKDIDGWFLNTDLYVLPDFDVLLFLEDFTINIDLKRQINHPHDICKKFKKQSRFFRMLDKINVYNIVFDVSNKSLQLFNKEKDSLEPFSFEELSKLIKNSTITYKNKIKQINPSKYLINPWKDLQNFSQKKYWLTKEQEEISIKLEKHGINGVSGEAGTGKTLIACDFMRRMNSTKKVLFIVPGEIDSDKNNWISSFNNIEISTAKNVSADLLELFDIIVVDEAQRIFRPTREILITWGEKNRFDKSIVFLFHEKQALGPKDSGNLIYNYLETIEKDKKGHLYYLSKNIRSNPAIYYFVRNLFDLKKKPPINITTEDYHNHIDLKYFDNEKDALIWIEKYSNKKGYKFLIPTSDNRKEASSDKFKNLSNKTNTHHFIGNEDNNVISYIDELLVYDSCSLKSISKEYYYLDNETYVNLTRARNKLALAVINNPDVYKGILDVIYKLK